MYTLFNVRHKEIVICITIVHEKKTDELNHHLNIREYTNRTSRTSRIYV